MSRVIKYINKLIANADPNSYDSVSYSTYFSNLATLSDVALEEMAAQDEKRKKLYKLAHELHDCKIKQEMLELIG